MKNSHDDESAVWCLLKKLPADYIKEVKSILSSNENSFLLNQAESLVSNTLRNSGLNWDDMTMHMKWKEILLETLRRRDEICS